VHVVVGRPRNDSLFYHRLRQGLTQEELAAAVHVSRQTINAIERRRREPTLSLALAIAHAVDASVEELFGAGAATAGAPR
jgi:putative transcriptional regulator